MQYLLRILKEYMPDYTVTQNIPANSFELAGIFYIK